MKGLVASLLNIKPMIGVEKINGTYIQLGQTRTFKNALQGLVDRIKSYHPQGTPLHVQVLHAFNPDGAAALRDLVDRTFDCTWLPLGPMSLVLGAHTGRSMVGVAFAETDAMLPVPSSK
jgi:fatty acid-binding protein DegV